MRFLSEPAVPNGTAACVPAPAALFAQAPENPLITPDPPPALWGWRRGGVRVFVCRGRRSAPARLTNTAVIRRISLSFVPSSLLQPPVPEQNYPPPVNNKEVYET